MKGDVCKKHNCHVCCLETEMVLTEKDVMRLCGIGHSRDDFCEEDGEGWLGLKNRDGHCVFLVDGICTVYEARSAGCRTYPLIWDADYGEVVRDDVCPHRGEFVFSKRDNAELLRTVDALLREREERKQRGKC